MNTADKKSSVLLHDYFDLMLIGSAHAFSDGFTNLLVPVLALIVADFNLSAFQAGLLLSSYSFSTFLFVFPVSLAADYSGKKLEILLAGLAVSSIAYFSMLGVEIFYLILILAFIAGAGNAVYHPCGTAITAERFKAIRPYAISVHGMMGNIGTSLIPVSMAFIAQMAGWRWAIASCTLPVIILLPALWIRFSTAGKSVKRIFKTGSHIKSSMSIALSVFRDHRVILLALVYALSGMGGKASVGFIPLLLTQKYGLSTAFVGIMISVYFGMGIAAKPLLGFLYAKFGVRFALGIPLLISFAATLSLGIVSWAPLLAVLIAVIGAANPISPVILTAAADFSDPEKLASSVGLIYSLHAASFVTPFISGFLADRAGLYAAFVFASVFFLSGAFLSTRLGKAVKQNNGGSNEE